MTNALRDLTSSELKKTERLAVVLQQVVRGLLGQDDNGIPIVATKYTGTGVANIYGSADPTNGAALKGISQDGKYHQIDNTGFSVVAPTGITGATTITGNTKIIGTLWVTLTSQLDGNVTIGASKWIATASTGAVAQAGDFAINTNKFTVAASTGNTLITGTGDVTGDFKVNTNKFTVTASSGDTLVAGTLSVTGDFAVATNKFTVAAATGNVAFPGDLAIDTNKFTVAGSTGNTLIAGTATITGDIVHDTTLLVTDVTNDKVGVGAVPVSTNAMLTVAGGIESSSLTGFPTSGTSLAWGYSTGGAGFGLIRSADHGGGPAYKALIIDGDNIQFRGMPSGEKFRVNNDGVGFFAVAPTAQAADFGAVATGTADATYGNAERDSINEHSVAINAVRTLLRDKGLMA